MEGTGIDLSGACASRIPTIKEIWEALEQFGLSVVKERTGKERIELVARSEEKMFRLIFTETESEDDESYMFRLDRGSDEDAALNFMRYMTATHGNFLYYSDSGAMSLITSGKTNNEIRKEMNR